jgi:uncharacterized damage-inducible protein DinB
VIAFCRPTAAEHAPYFSTYIDKVSGEDALAAIVAQQPLLDALATLPEAKAGHRYADGKWSVREMIGHMSDTERIFAYRLMRIGRGDQTPLPGFDQDPYIAGADFEARTLADVVGEFRAVRAATLALMRPMTAEAAARMGVANDRPTSARAIGWMIPGHVTHHAGILRERYGVEV